MPEKDNKHDIPGEREPGEFGLEGMEPPASLLPDVLAHLGLLDTLPARYQQGLPQDRQSWQRRAQDIQALGKSHEPSAFQEIVDCLHDDHEAVRAAALRALAEQAERTSVPMEFFTHALNDTNSEVRATAVQILGARRDQAPLEELLSALDDENKTVRIAAIQALGKMGRRIPIERLVAVLRSDSSWPVRETAVLTLGAIRERMPLEWLLESLYDSSPSVRETAAFVLKDHMDTVVARVSHDLEYANLPVREAAARTLGELAPHVPQEQLREPLIYALKMGKYTPVRIAAMLALEQLEDHPDIVRAFSEASRDGDVEVCQLARLFLESTTQADPETKMDVFVEGANALKSTAPVNDTNFVGRQLGQYRVINTLGRGSRATVYLGQHVLLETYAAIKVLKDRLSDKDLQERVVQIRTIAQLHHPHIVRILDSIIVKKEGMLCLVMEYAPHGTLREKHPEGTQVPLPTVVSYVKQVAGALDYIHEKGVLHQDIKPENMLLNSKDEVLLSDFGIATVVNPTRRHPYDNRIAGTPAYMAPERFKVGLNQASDQYSLAVVAYEWLCGEPPFAGYPNAVITQHLDTPPPPLRSKVPYLPPKVEAVIEKALAKDPRDRYQSVQVFADALEQASAEVSALDRLKDTRNWWTMILSWCRILFTLVMELGSRIWGVWKQTTGRLRR